MIKGTEKLILYHGTCLEFEKVDLKYSKDKRDFGKGFYTTTSQEQAEKWAKSQAERSDGRPFVLIFTMQDWTKVKVKEFLKADKSWLEMVKQNRVNGGTNHIFDIVIGPVANDRTYPTVQRYLDGTYTADEAIRRLKTWIYENQVSFHTEIALSKLIFQRRYQVDV